MMVARDDGPRTPTEFRAVYAVVEKVVNEALLMSLSTPKAQRAVELLALHASIPDRLIAEGVAPDRAVRLAPSTRVTVEVAADEN